MHFFVLIKGILFRRKTNMKSPTQSHQLLKIEKSPTSFFFHSTNSLMCHGLTTLLYQHEAELFLQEHISIDRQL